MEENLTGKKQIGNYMDRQKYRQTDRQTEAERKKKMKDYTVWGERGADRQTETGRKKEVKDYTVSGALFRVQGRNKNFELE